MKNRNIRNAATVLTASLFFLLALAGCADNFVRVSVPFPPDNPLPFSTYSRIILGEFTETMESGDYTPDIHIRDFFTRDVATLIEKPVELIPDLTPDSERLATLGPALLITGSLKSSFNRRNMISETRGKYGDHIRAFREVENGSMELTVILTDTLRKEKIAEFSARRQLKEIENPDTRFNYRKLFNHVTDRFVGRLTARERRRDRYLLEE